jgi:hypothetical protein
LVKRLTAQKLALGSERGARTGGAARYFIDVAACCA